LLDSVIALHYYCWKC